MDISSAIFDPELGCTAFAVERITCTRSRSGTTSQSTTAQALGCIHPGTPEMLRLLPEEEQNEQFIEIFTDYALSTAFTGTAGPGAWSASGTGEYSDIIRHMPC